MAQQTINTVDRTGTINPIALAASASSGGDVFANTGVQFVAWGNLGTSSITITEVLQATIDGQTPTGKQFTMPPPVAPPSAPTLGQSAGGTEAAETVYVKITYTNPSGETVPSAESNFAKSLNNLLTVTSPAASGNAAGYNVYASTTTGTETKQNATPINLGTNWMEPTSGLTNTGATVPTINTTPSMILTGPYP